MRIIIDFSKFQTESIQQLLKHIEEDINLENSTHLEFLENVGVETLDHPLRFSFKGDQSIEALAFVETLRDMYPQIAFECLVISKEIKNKYFDFDPIGFKTVEVSSFPFDKTDSRLYKPGDPNQKTLAVEFFKDECAPLNMLHSVAEDVVLGKATVKRDKHIAAELRLKERNLFNCLAFNTNTGIEYQLILSVSSNNNQFKLILGAPTAIEKCGKVLIDETFSFEQLKAFAGNIDRLSYVYHKDQCVFECLRALFNYFNTVQFFEPRD